MFKDYLEQYKKINGISDNINLNIYNQSFQKEFLDFQKQRKETSNKYIDFLYQLKKNIIEQTTAEVLKGEYDSIMLPFDTLIISPEEISDIDKDRFIRAYFMILDGEPLLYFYPGNNPMMIKIPFYRIDTIMTQNPYNYYNIRDFDELHNSGKFDIAIGMYGSIYDKNIDENLEMLKGIKDKIIGNDYQFVYDKFGDIYCSCLVSDRKKLIKKR